VPTKERFPSSTKKQTGLDRQSKGRKLSSGYASALLSSFTNKREMINFALVERYLYTLFGIILIIPESRNINIIHL
jgi:hypothetical protein